MDVRAIFFDAGETLLYPHPSFSELFAEVLREQGRVVDPTRVQEVVSAYSKRFTDTVVSGEGRLWSTSRDRSKDMWRGIYEAFFQELGIDGDRERLFEALYGRFTDLSSYRLHPDALPLLDRLTATDLVLGLISNFEEWLERLLEALEVQHYFDVTVISGVEGVEKPDPEIFRIALARAGVEAGGAVYVGDHPFFDVEAAREVGMVPVLVDRPERHPGVDAIRVTSLEDLPAAIGIEA